MANEGITGGENLSEDFDKSDFDKSSSENADNADRFRDMAMKKNFARIEPLLNAILNRIRQVAAKGGFQVFITVWDSKAESEPMSISELQSLNFELRNRFFSVDLLQKSDHRWRKVCRNIDTSGRGISKVSANDVGYRQSYLIQWGK